MSPSLRCYAVAFLLSTVAAFSNPAGHAWFLKAREAERAGDDRTALRFYGQAFRHDSKSRDLCFIYLNRLKLIGSMDSSATLAKRCADLPGKPLLSEYKALGEVALRAEDIPGAILYYRAALALDEEDGDALYVLTGLYGDAGDWAAYVDVAGRLMPRLNYPAALMERQLQAYARLDSTQAALSLLEAAWAATGRLHYGQSLAGYYDARGMYRSLLKVSRKLAETQPGEEYQWLLARSYAAADRPDSALRICEILLKSPPQNPLTFNRDILYLYANLLFDTGRYKEAYTAAEEWVKVDTGGGPSLLLWGSAALELRRSEARTLLERALTRAPFSPDYRARLAYADYVFKSPAHASARLTYAVNDSVTQIQALFLEGLAQGQLARQLEPHSAWERPSVYVDTVAARHHRLEAIARFEKVLTQDSVLPRKRIAQFELASHLERLGDRPRAEELLRALSRQDTLNARAMNYLGYMLVENLPVSPAKLNEAGSLLDRALALDPENGAYLDSKGWWAYRAGLLDSARFYLESAAETIPSDPAILGHLAEVFMAQGHVAEGCAMHREVHRRDPTQAVPAMCDEHALNSSPEKTRP